MLTGLEDASIPFGPIEGKLISFDLNLAANYVNQNYGLCLFVGLGYCIWLNLRICNVVLRLVVYIMIFKKMNYFLTY